jgi:dTDP-4-dehydrorhamnose 3,5-epimerase
MFKNVNAITIIKKSIFKDSRGYYIESFNKKDYPINFVQDDFSSSKKGVLRGFHGDAGTWKLFSCIYGKVQFGFINNNTKSNNFKKNITITLEERDNLQILVPPKFGTAHLVLSDRAIIHYKQSSYYQQFKQFTINYKSKAINFKWKSKKIITSLRDKGGILLD